MSKVPTMEELERAAIKKALRETDSKTAAAEALGIDRSTLYRKLDKYGIRNAANLGFGGSGSGEGLLSSLMDG